jgi:hypothetical protein
LSLAAAVVVALVAKIPALAAVVLVVSERPQIFLSVLALLLLSPLVAVVLVATKTKKAQAALILFFPPSHLLGVEEAARLVLALD